MYKTLKGLYTRLLVHIRTKRLAKKNKRIESDCTTLIMKLLPTTCEMYVEDNAILSCNPIALRATTIRGLQVPKTSVLAHSAVMEDIVTQISGAVCEDVLLLLRYRIEANWIDTTTIVNLVKLQARIQMSCTELSNKTNHHVAAALSAALTDDKLKYGSAMAAISKELMVASTPGVYAAFYDTAVAFAYRDRIPNLSMFLRKANAQRTSGVSDV